jgi:hypothetical protein
MAAAKNDFQGDLFGFSDNQSLSDPNVVFTRTLPSEDKLVPVSTIVASSSKSTARPAKDQPIDDLDAGEELVANRRGKTSIGLQWNDISQWNDTLKAKEVIKQKVWPKPDYEELIQGGMNPVVAYIVKHVYDQIPSKPKTGRGRSLDDAAFQTYIISLNMIKESLFAWAGNNDDVSALLRSGSVPAVRGLGEMISVKGDYLKGRSLQDRLFPAGSKGYPEEFSVLGWGVYSDVQPRYDEVKKAVEQIKAGWPSKREAWQVQGYSISENPEVHVEKNKHAENSYLVWVGNSYLYGFKSDDEARAKASSIKSYVLWNKNKKYIDSFDTHAEALQAARDQTSREKKATISDKGIKVEAAQRVGAARRVDGENITSEKILQVFGLKGVNFGNWMKTAAAREEAQLHLNHAYDSLMDLSELLGVPPKAIGLNGMLGLAVGAQGKGGGAAAHFVPGVNEINITREFGSGFLAHEYGHALDHYFATVAELKTLERPFLTEYCDAAKPMGLVRAEIFESFKNIVSSMLKRDETKEEHEAESIKHAEKQKKRLESWIESVKRDFVRDAKEPHPAFDEIANRIRRGEYGEGSITVGRGRHFYPIVVELRDLFKKEKGRVYSIDESQRLQYALMSCRPSEEQEDSKPRKVKTDYLKNAIELDKEKGGKTYWSTTTELFARAFDAYVSDKLKAKGCRNDYLALTEKRDETVPGGEERIRINEGFSSLVEHLRHMELNGRVSLYSKTFREPQKGAISLSVMNDTLQTLRGKWPGMPVVRVVDTASEISANTDSNAQALYSEGAVWLVRQNIASKNDLQRVLAHECVMHHSLMEMLGPKQFGVISGGIQALKHAGDPTVVALAKDVYSTHGYLRPKDESAEIIARAGEQCLSPDGEVKVQFGFMKGVLSHVAGWLREKGFEIKVTNAEIGGLIHRASKAIENAVKEEVSLDDTGHDGASLPAFKVSRRSAPSPGR